MRQVSAALGSFLASSTNAIWRHLLTLTLSDSTVYRWTDHETDLVVGGATFVAGGTGTAPSFTVDSRRDPAGTEIGEAEVTLDCGEAATIGGVRIPLAVTRNVLDRAKVKIERVFGDSSIDTSLGTLNWFEGVVAETDPSSTQVKLSLADGREELNAVLPHTEITPSCQNTLYDSQCGANRVSFQRSGMVSAGAGTLVFQTNRTQEPSDYFALGVITFFGNVTAALAGIKRSVRAYRPATGEFELDEPLPVAPQSGDTFTAVPGCNHKWSDANGCAKFSRQARFRGCPLLPKDSSSLRVYKANPFTKYGTGAPAEGYTGLALNVSPPSLPLPLVYGRAKVRGIPIYRGKAGKHYVRMSAFCEGPIVGGRRFWVNDKFYSSVHNLDAPGSQAPLGTGGPRFANATLALGTRPDQSAFWWLTYYDTSYAVCYPGIAYWATALTDQVDDAYDLEVDGFLSGSSDAGSSGDAHPASIITDATVGLLGSGVGAAFRWPVETDLGPDGTTASGARRYLDAAGIRLSCVIDTKTKVIDVLDELLRSSNCSCRWSEGQLEMLALSDVALTDNGYAYVPDPEVEYALDDAHFQPDGDEDPVAVKRPAREEIVNIVPVEFEERDPNSNDPSRAYESRPVEDPDPVDVSNNGPLRGDTVALPMVKLPDVAVMLSRILSQLSVRRRNSYTFKIHSLQFGMLEPLDCVSITDKKFGLTDQRVRIRSIEEDKEGILTIVAQDAPVGLHHAVRHPVQSSEGAAIDTRSVSFHERVHALALANWTAKTIPAVGVDGYMRVRWLVDRFIAVGDAKIAWSNYDGDAWTAATIPANYYLYDVASNDDGSVMVAIGQNTSPVNIGSSLRSTDHGATWSAVSLPGNAAATKIIWVKALGLFVFVAGTTCYTSPTGLAGSWTSHAMPAQTYRGPETDGATILVAADGGCARSTDAVNWTWIPQAFNIDSLECGPNSQFAAFINGNLKVGTTYDLGSTWSVADLPFVAFSQWIGMTWSGSLWAVTNYAAIGKASVWTSPNGLVYTQAAGSLPATAGYESIASSPCRAVLVGGGTAASSLLYGG